MNQNKYTIKEVAERLYVSEKTVTRWAKDKKVPSVLTPSGRYIFLKTDIDNFIRRHYGETHADE